MLYHTLKNVFITTFEKRRKEKKLKESREGERRRKEFKGLVGLNAFEFVDVLPDGVDVVSARRVFAWKVDKDGNHGRRFMVAWRKEEVDAARHHQEKREATRLGSLLSQTGV